MITIASNYAAADDDARESLKASAIQNTGKRNINNKRKNPPEEQQTPDMVATTFVDKGQSSQRGRGCGSNSGQPRSSTALASAPSAPMSYDEYHDMPCFAHRDASRKCNHTNRNSKFVNDLKADHVGDITPGIPKYPFSMTNICCMTSFMCRDIQKQIKSRLGRHIAKAAWPYYA
jgi:hypothetical protein